MNYGQLVQLAQQMSQQPGFAPVMYRRLNPALVPLDQLIPRERGAGGGGGFTVPESARPPQPKMDAVIGQRPGFWEGRSRIPEYDDYRFPAHTFRPSSLFD